MSVATEMADEETSLIENQQTSYASLEHNGICEVEATGSFEVINGDWEAGAEENVNDEPGIDNDAPTVPAGKAGCVRCRAETKIETFRKIKAGDHIAVRGQIPCIGRCYDHHAIVTDVQIAADGKDVHVTVVDVNEIEKRYTGCHCVSCSLCCIRGKICSCSTYSYPIKERELSQQEASSFISKRHMRRIDYRKRKNNHHVTKQRALQMCNVVNNLEYSVLFQNCEHAAAACVNAPDENIKQALIETLSVQSHRCCWRIWHVVFWMLQALFYALNFCIYAVFVAKDEDFDLFSNPLDSFLQKICYNPNNCVRGFDTTCDWKLVAIFSTISSLIFVVLQVAIYQPLYNKGYICRQCLITSRLDCFSRVFAFVLVEGISIFLENPIYTAVTKLHTGNSTYAIIIGVSLIGAFLVYSVSSLITWALGACCIPSCKGVREFTRYFKFRGLTKLCLFIIRKIYKVLYWIMRKARSTSTRVTVQV